MILELQKQLKDVNVRNSATSLDSRSVNIVINKNGEASQSSLVEVVGTPSNQSRDSKSSLKRAASKQDMELLAQDWLYEVKPSTWDCLIYLGMGLMSVNDDIILLTTAVISIAFEGMFRGLRRHIKICI